MPPTMKGYTPQLFWDQEAGYWVAEIREIPTCAADGETPAEAVSNLEETFAVLKEAYAEEAVTLPSPDPALPITVADVARMSEIVNVSNLARKAGFSPQTLASKIKRGTEFNAVEARRVAMVLEPMLKGWSADAWSKSKRASGAVYSGVEEVAQEVMRPLAKSSPTWKARRSSDSPVAKSSAKK